jgi:ribosomal protein L37E
MMKKVFLVLVGRCAWVALSVPGAAPAACCFPRAARLRSPVSPSTVLNAVSSPASSVLSLPAPAPAAMRSNAAMAFLPAAPMGLRASSASPARAGRLPLGLRMQQATVDREQDNGVGQAAMRKDAESLMQPCPETK